MPNPPPPEPSADILARARAGEDDACEWIFRNYRPPFLKMAWYHFTPNSADVEDATIEALEDVFKGLPRVRDHARFSTWAYRVAWNRMLANKRRMRKDRRLVSLDERSDVPGETMDDERARREREQERQTEEAIEKEQELMAFMELSTFIQQLPETDGYAMCLVDLMGFSIEDAARILCASNAAVRQRLSRGRRKISELRGR